MSPLFAFVATVVVEVAVAALFQVGRRGLLAVALVNVVTNPIFNIAIAASVAVTMAVGGRPDAVLLLAVLLLEAAVVVAEWRLLVWALRSTAGSPDKLLALSIAMNLASMIFALPLWMVM